MKRIRIRHFTIIAAAGLALISGMGFWQSSAAGETEKPLLVSSALSGDEEKRPEEEKLPSETAPVSSSESTTASESGTTQTSSESGTAPESGTTQTSSENGTASESGTTQTSSESGTASESETTQTSSENGTASEPETTQTSSENGTTSESETPPSSSESETASESETPDTSSGSEKESETGTQEPSSESGETPDSDAPQPEWPQGHYLVRITDAAVKLPEGGRIYDGTDRINVTFHTKIDREPQEKDEPEEEIPEYQVTCTSHLQGADAGEQKVVCAFTLQTSWPEHVKLDTTTIHPDLKVNVKKATLRVAISNGTKRYGDPADLKHIRLAETSAVVVSGFIKDASGEELVPSGFKPPQIEVDKGVLDQWSPVYAQAGRKYSGTMAVREYAHALILKKDAQGRVTGNATENYQFCTDPEDEKLSGGTVTIERASVKRDVSYELKGEKGAYRIESDGTVIVRAGTSLKVKPLAGQGYNTGTEFANIRNDASLSFRLEQRNKDGSLVSDSEEETIYCRVDDSAPTADIQVSGTSWSGGDVFSSSVVRASILVPEDTISGLAGVRYRILSESLNADNVSAFLKGGRNPGPASEWTDTEPGASVTLPSEAICALEVEVSDQVGNISLARSQAVAVDSRPPGIRITGVEDQSANASAVRIQVRCEDPSYLPGSLKAEMKADFGGIIPEFSLNEDTPGQAVLSFQDFPGQKEADAVYHLSVTAQDRAGNHSTKEISFSVNRFGSSYSLETGTAEKLKRFYHRKPFDVTFMETNLDSVGSARILLRVAGSLEELREGSGMIKSERKGSEGVSQYFYTVPADRFSKDGTYEVMLLTSDRAGNSSDSTAQKLPVRFAIDTESPECLVTGVSPNGRYQEEKMTAVIEVRDQQALETVDVYLDSKKAEKLSREREGSAGEVIKLPLTETEAWQTIQVHAEDKAGNELWTPEIPVYLSSIDPESAEDYHATRLSARQMVMIRNAIMILRKGLSGTKLLHGKTAITQTGAVKNLYQAAKREERNEAGKGQASVSIQTLQKKAQVFPVGVVLMIAAVSLPAGIFLYRRRRSS